VKETWRWFGPQDPVSLDNVKQAGATGVVSALHHFYRGETWPLEEVLKRKAEIEAAGLIWSVVESIPVHTSIKLMTGPFHQFIGAWKDSLAAISRAGVPIVCYKSAGRRKSSRIPSGNVYLKSALVEAANAAARAKGTYLRDKFFRLKARRGYKRAVVAIAHKILVAIYHMLSQQVSYNDLGDLYLDKLNKNHLTRNLVHRLERLGYQVTLTPQQQAA
jgi:hypothetical protein